MLDQIWENIQRVKAESPLVHNITNAVVMNNTANALLAAGASPIMAHALEEIDEMVALCRATVINIGTLDRFTVESMKAAIRRANEVGHPVVLDPVGAGATSFRNQTLRDILVAGTPTFIRGNASEIMTMAEDLLKHPEKKHGKIRIGFTPDEEVGAGADHFDVKLFGADYAYTVDGGALGELEYENFNAAGAKLHVYGRSVHPGSAKGKMKNAILIAQEFQKLLPVEQNPMYTEGYEGFFHLDAICGNVEEVTADYIIRDHNRQLFEQKKELFLSCADFLNRKYGEGTAIVDMKDSYYNMREIMEQHMHLIDNAKAAMEELGIEPRVSPIRGGTDGARLSFMGLPCPNLCTGGENYHGRYEYACVQSMEKTTGLLIAIAAKYADR